MNKIKLLTNGNPQQSQKLIKEILYNNDVMLSRTYINANKLFALCNSARDVDNLFKKPCLEALKKVNCTPILPPDIKAKRSIILKNCDEDILLSTPQEITSEIEKLNRVTIDDIFKFTSNKSMKITLDSQSSAERLLKEGIKMFYISHSANNIFPEIFIELEICYKCFKIEDHSTANCPEPKEYKRCSVCSSVDHIFKECPNPENLTCIHCSGYHSSLALSCPVRKSFIRTKRKTLSPTATHIYINKNNTDNSQINKYITYASSISNGPEKNISNSTRNEESSKPTQLPTTTHSEVSHPSIKPTEYSANILSAILIATLKNDEQNGCFEYTLNELFSANNLPKFKMGTIAPPSPSSFFSNKTPPLISAKKK